MKLKLKLPKVTLDQELSLREKIFFALAMTAFGFIFLSVFWSPASEQIVLLKTQLKSVETEIDGLTKLIEGTKAQLALRSSQPPPEVKVDAAAKKMLERKVLDPLGEVHATVAALSSRKFAKGISVEDVKIGQAVEKEAYSMIPLTVHLSGRAGAGMNFLSSLEAWDRPVVVRKFTIRRDVEKGGIEGSIDLELYVIKR